MTSFPNDPAEPTRADLLDWLVALRSGGRSLPAIEQRPPTAPTAVTIAWNVPGLPLVYANDAFMELTGYRVGEVLGRNCRFLQGVGTDPRDIATLSRAMHEGRDVSIVLHNYRSDGSVFLNQVSISPIRDPANRITHYIGTQIDVTRWGKPIVCDPPSAIGEPVSTARPAGRVRSAIAA